jgi:UDP-perosamine 4-acetyltransferase
MRIVVVGAARHAKVVMESLSASGVYEIVGLTDPDQSKWGMLLGGYLVLGGDDVLPTLRSEGVNGAIIALGDNRLRARLFEHAITLGFKMVNAIHPRSWISPSAQIGNGVAVMAGAVINADAQVGDNVIINTGATVDHDCYVGDHVHIAPGCHIGGSVQVGTGTLVGIGVSVIPDRSIGRWSIVGAGAVVVRDLPDNCVAIGVPATVKDIKG